jgi:hypothetical protein
VYQVKEILAVTEISLLVRVAMAVVVAEEVQLILEEIQGLMVRAVGLILVEMALTA